MLALSRKAGQTIKIGKDIVLTFIRVKGGQCRVGIQAPLGLKILRGELPEEPKQKEPVAA